MEISLRYTPVTGRLHTRYAPVRRSPPEYCYSALPLDLHVLSLPLAFILSQDQTLHCKNCSCEVFRFTFYVLRPSLTFLTRLRVHIISYIMYDTRYLYLLIISINCRFQVENGCKSTTFFRSGKIFFQKNRNSLLKVLSINGVGYEKNFTATSKPLCRKAAGAFPGCKMDAQSNKKSQKRQ